MTLVSPSPLKLAAGLLALTLFLLLRCDVREWRQSSGAAIFDGPHSSGPDDTADSTSASSMMTVIRWLCGLLPAVVTLTGHGHAQAIGTDIPLPSYPLAVKSPYLSTWLPGYAVNDTARAQPQFWTGQNLTWPVIARVDGTTYALFGDSGGRVERAATTDAATFTSTHTYFQVTAGAVKFTLDFFTPVFPGKGEYARQSLPYSYLTVTAASTGYTPASVQVLSGIDQTWTAQDERAGVNFTTSGSTGLFWFYNPNAPYYTERGDIATYGSVVFAASSDQSVTQTCGPPDSVLESFSQDGVVAKSTSCNGSDLVAISQDLGQVGGGKRSEAAPASATFVVGLQRDYAINYLGKPQTGYHRSQWPTIPGAVDYVLDSYQSALEHSKGFDQLIRSKAEGVSSEYGSDYADIVEASVRQTFATIDITVPLDDRTATPSVYLKEISSDGNLNTVDLIFQTWPVFISLNPEYIRMMFQPILKYSNAGRWPHDWVIHDLGTHYPNASGHDNGRAEQMPLFETSSLFILLLAYEQLTGDKAHARHYTPLLRGYADWLASNNSLYPSSQLISVDSVAAKPNQTGLAVQSAIGLKAASVLLGESRYAALAAAHVNEIWYNGLGLDGAGPKDSSHFTYYYGQNGTWNVLFPAFADVALGLRTFPAEAWELQSAWYLEAIQDCGLPWSHATKWGLLDWNIVAAAVSGEEVQRAVVRTSHAFLTNGVNDEPFGTRYFVTGPRKGQWLSNKARPTVGSNFAILALKEGLIYEG